MQKNYIVKEKDNQLVYDSAFVFNNPYSIGLINHPIRIKLLESLSKEPMYPAQLAKKLKMHEQKIYYHIKQLLNSGILEMVERKEIRGTVAKKYKPKEMNFVISLSNNWKNIDKLITEEQNKELNQFLSPFIKNHKINCNIVVGSPDPHGPEKARARDGHYAIDLAIFLGNYGSLSKKFSTILDVDIATKKKNNLILVGGPITNLIVSKVNDMLPIKFSEKKPHGIISEKTGKNYTDESCGFIARIPNPYNPENKILVLAGIRFSGTKSAVIALTRHPKLIMQHFSNQKNFACIVQGFDLDGDGKIDNIELLE